MAGTAASPGWILCHSALPGVVLARTMGTTLFGHSRLLQRGRTSGTCGIAIIVGCDGRSHMS